MTEFTQLEKPPRGWKDIGSPHIFYRELKSGPQYLCRYCGEINHPHSSVYHRPGCPKSPAYVIELEPGVWVCDVEQSDPGRVRDVRNAQRFSTRRGAEDALAAARKFRPFARARISRHYEATE